MRHGSPLVWTLPGMPGFVALTLAANSAQVVLLPLLAGGLWWITASGRLIGDRVPESLVGERGDARALRARGLFRDTGWLHGHQAGQ